MFILIDNDDSFASDLIIPGKQTFRQSIWCSLINETKSSGNECLL